MRNLPPQDALLEYLTVPLTEMFVGSPVTVVQPAQAAPRPALPGRAGATLRRRELPATPTPALLRLLSSSPPCAPWPSWRRS